MSPTQRTKKLLTASGFKIGNVERYISFAKTDPRSQFMPGKKFDLFGIIDMIAIKKGRTVGVQSTGTAFKQHIDKILSDDHIQDLVDWLDAGNEFILIGWRKVKVKRGGKLMIYKPRIAEFYKIIDGVDYYLSEELI